jgi:amphi-Trp domain-containing protein
MPATIPTTFQGRVRRDAAAFYLSELARALQEGELRVQVGGREIRLATSDVLSLQIVVKLKRRDNQVDLRVRWPRRPLIRAVSGPVALAGESPVAGG